MTKSRVFAAIVLAGALFAPLARADSVGPESLVSQSVLVSGQHSGVYAFNAVGPGTLTVRLENISWPERLANLDCSIYSSGGFLESLRGTNELKFVADGPMSFYANVFAGAAGRLKLGLFSIKVTFESAAAPVPLPAAAWLLASALGLLGFRRHAWPALRFMFGRAQIA